MKEAPVYYFHTERVYDYVLYTHTHTHICIHLPQLQICLDPNPHMGNLAWADAFVITADSVSMLCEACSTGYVCFNNCQSHTS